MVSPLPRADEWIVSFAELPPVPRLFFQASIARNLATGVPRPTDEDLHWNPVIWEGGGVPLPALQKPKLLLEPPCRFLSVSWEGASGFAVISSGILITS
jgi:hypothetical protein